MFIKFLNYLSFHIFFNEPIKYQFYEFQIFNYNFIIIFVIFNFFGKNFLGDGAAYGISLFVRIYFIKKLH